MSRIYDQLKSLEAGIRNTQGEAAPEADARAQAARTRPAQTDAPAALPVYPVRSKGQLRYYLAAATVVVSVAFYALTDTRLPDGAAPAASTMPQAQTVAGIPVASVDQVPQQQIARPPQGAATRRIAKPSLRKSRLAASRLKVPGLTNNGRSTAQPDSGPASSSPAISATTETMGGWESRAATIRAQMKAGAYPDIVMSARMLTEDFPDRWEPWFWLGTAQLAQGRKEAAETALERASDINPKDARIWVQRAVVAQERGDHAAALRLLGMARELSPGSPQIYLNMGYSNDALGQAARAEENYRRFLALTEGNGSYLAQRKPVLQRLEGSY